ncbi:lamin tail domain-containing protein [uncultured Jatrophihabitans sp.]|uniref:lamin tail domain-containing protein n=1 Tax=uncultured Jatrophihabitans sp. TaxID=1610747 RepID=UPI0035C98E61
MHPSLTRSRLRAAAALVGVAAATLGVTAAQTPAGAAPSTTLVVNEVYGGGGNTGATLKNDFVELYNAGTGAVSLSGYSVQYLTGSPTATAKWSVDTLTGSIPAGKTFLVRESAGSGGTDDGPTPDDTGSLSLGGTSGTVALVHSTDARTCVTSADCTADTAITDLVGYGTATVHEGTADAPAPSNTTSVSRTGGKDTDQNGPDFTVGAPSPTPSGTTGGGGGGTEPGPLAIHDIQGTSFVSPQNGNSVSNVAGVVTTLRTSGSKGFWMQDPKPDANPATSEGIFVYTGSTPAVKVGDSVLVSGKVSDYYALGSGETLSSTSSLSVTELTAPTVTVVASGAALPAPVVIGPNTVPDTYAPDLGNGNIEKTPITPTRSALDYYESVEGMRVEVDDVRVVGPSNSYGEQYVTTKPTQAATYRGGTELLGENRTPSGRLEVATLDGTTLGLDVGDVLTGATTGVIDWSTYGGYVLDASTVGTPQHNHLAPVTAKAGSKKQLSIATYNVENLAPGDSADKFTALAKGVITNLATPDIVALEEIQDNDGATDDGTVAADTTITKLTNAIVAAGGPHYDYRLVDPVNDQDGGQPGGNIRNVFLYNPARVTFVDRGAPSVDRSVTGTQVTKTKGAAALTLSPGRIDPTNPVWTSSRKPLAGEFRFQGKPVIVVANHFDAKLGDQNSDGRFQYAQQSSQTQRAGQALVVHDFVAKILAAQKSADVVVVGDLNDYQFSSPLAVLRTGSADGSGTPILTDLITTLPVDQQYTYVYNGVSQVLDHILVTPKVRGVTYQVVHVNAEFNGQTSDHDPQVVDIRP